MAAMISFKVHPEGETELESEWINRIRQIVLNPSSLPSDLKVGVYVRVKTNKYCIAVVSPQKPVALVDLCFAPKEPVYFSLVSLTKGKSMEGVEVTLIGIETHEVPSLEEEEDSMEDSDDIPIEIDDKYYVEDSDDEMDIQPTAQSNGNLTQPASTSTKNKDEQKQTKSQQKDNKANQNTDKSNKKAQNKPDNKPTNKADNNASNKADNNSDDKANESKQEKEEQTDKSEQKTEQKERKGTILGSPQSAKALQTLGKGFAEAIEQMLKQQKDNQNQNTSTEQSNSSPTQTTDTQKSEQIIDDKPSADKVLRVTLAKPLVRKLPSGVVQEDHILGNGQRAVTGKVITINYSVKNVDGTFSNEITKTFRLGISEFIRAFDYGIVGMRVGGLRTLKAPKHLVEFDKLDQLPKALRSEEELVFKEVRSPEMKREKSVTVGLHYPNGTTPLTNHCPPFLRLTDQWETAAAASGKSTFAKQMKILYCQGFTDDELQNYKSIMVQNLLLGFKDALLKAEESSVTVGKKCKKAAKYFTSVNPFTTPLTPDVVEKAKSLWNDPSFKELCDKISKFEFSESLDYIMNNIDRIATDNWTPTYTDVLYIRQRTTGLVETNFKAGKYRWTLIDVGGQKVERRKWVHTQQNLQAVIYFAALDDYNVMSDDDPNITRMEESLQIWADTMRSDAFDPNLAIILFLNKYDLFQEKIKKVPLKKTYKKYKGGDDVQKATEFIRDLYFARLDPNGKFRPTNIYVHATVAVSTDNIRVVFQCVMDNIFKQRLRESGI